VNRSRAIRLVAKREITQRVREKAFLVSTLFSLAVIAVVVFLPALLDNDESGFAIGVTQDVPQEMRGALAGARVLAGGGS
jgi:ABC-type Na+ efflux pump permease subunit